MIPIILQFLISAFVIVLAGSFLAKFSDRIAEETGLGRLLIGSVLLAGATSLPELMVDLNAIWLGEPDLAVGDLLGSSLFNLLILSVLDFAFPSDFRRTVFSPAFLHHGLMAMLSVLLTAIVGIGILTQLNTSLFGVSIFSWAILILYLLGLRLTYLEKDYPSFSRAESLEQHSSNVRPDFKTVIRKRSFILALVGYCAAAATILMAAPFLVRAANQIAQVSGLGQTFIGTTLVALATSLPELISTLTAFRMGAPDLAIGNIFGSNTFNMVLFAPLDIFYPKVLFSSVKGIHAVTAFSVITATSVAVMGQLYRKKERSRFSEPSSEIVVVLVLAFMYLLYKTQVS